MLQQIKCDFCLNKLRTILSYNLTLYANCHNCHVKFVYTEDFIKNKICFNFLYNGTDSTLTVNLLNRKTYLNINNDINELSYEFDYVMDVNPNNLLQKINTCLIFM